MIVHVYSLRRDSLGMRLVAISCCGVVFVCLFVFNSVVFFFLADALKFTLTLSSGMPTLWRSWLFGLWRENMVCVCALV